MKKFTHEDLIKGFKKSTFPETFSFKTDGDDSLAPQNSFLKHAGFNSLDIYRAGLVSLMHVMNGRHKKSFGKNGVKTYLSLRKDTHGHKIVLFGTANRIPKSIFFVRRIDQHPSFVNQYKVTGFKGHDSKTDITLVLDKTEVHPLLKHLFLGE